MGRGGGETRGIGAPRQRAAGPESRNANCRIKPRRVQRVLSIDGGGIRGIIPARVLAELEERTGKPTSELFDLISGTSTGAIIALALAAKGPDGKPRWRAQDLVDLYEQEGPDIFQRSLWHKLRSGFGLFAPKYSSKNLEAKLEKYLGDQNLSETMTDVLVPAYETMTRKPFFFKSRKARMRKAFDFKLTDVARATTAAPTFFPAAAVESPASAPAEGEKHQFSLVDGGVFANNPAMCAWADVQKKDPGSDVLMLSLGTGNGDKPLRYEKVRKWGIDGWGLPPEIINVALGGVSEATDYQLQQLLGHQSYLRLQPRLTKASAKMDNASKRNIHALHDEADELISRNSNRLDSFIEKLEAATPLVWSGAGGKKKPASAPAQDLASA